MTLGPSAFFRDVTDNFEALTMVQAIIEHGGTVISVCPNGRRREVYAVLTDHTTDTYEAIDNLFAQRMKP